MCRPSPISPDWVTKGFHVHVGPVEIVVRPGHEPGLVVFASFFSSVDSRSEDAAIRSIRDNCLADPVVRERWRHTIDRAIRYLDGYDGELADLATAGRRN